MFIAMSEDREILGTSFHKPALLEGICRQIMFDNPGKVVSVPNTPTEYGFYNVSAGGGTMFYETFTIEEHDVW